MAGIDGLREIKTDQRRTKLRQKRHLCDSLICLVGQQTIPTVIAALYWRPKHLYLVFTGKTEKQKELLSNWAEKYLVDKVFPVYCPNECDLFWTDKSHNKMPKDGKVIVDMTGGTKLMSFGLTLYGQKIGATVVYYNDKEQRFLNLDMNEEYQIEDNLITWQDMFEVSAVQYKIESTTAQHRQYSQIILDGILDSDIRAPLMRLIRTPIISKKMTVKNKDLEKYTNDAFLSWVKTATQQGLINVDSHKSTIVIGKDKTKLFKGKYLESILSCALESLHHKSVLDNYAINVHLPGTVNTNDEITELDGIFSWNNTIFLISCKTGSPAEVKKEMHALQVIASRIGGSRSRGILLWDPVRTADARNVEQQRMLFHRGITLVTDKTTLYDPAQLSSTLLNDPKRPVADV